MLKILWADDEIELLKPHILFLKAKGYDVIPVTDGRSALETLDKDEPDIIFLDEQMPGLSGLDVLGKIKTKYPSIPVVMITKSEEESIMEQAIGSKISDYLIKPVNPNQILLVLKKHLIGNELIKDTTVTNYQQEFREIGLKLNERLGWNEWIEVYRKLVYWELELSSAKDSSFHEILKQQKEEANRQFCKFYESNYEDWLQDRAAEKPPLSHTVLREKLFPLFESDRPTFLLVIDNLRFDQWKAIQSQITPLLRVKSEEMYYSILPTTTQYARNALFSGLMPSEIQKKYPKYWVNEDQEGNKNDFEPQLMDEYLRRFGINIKQSYYKVLNLSFGWHVVDLLPNLMGNKLNIIIYNFVDMLSHARTSSDLVRELAEDEKAYRAVTATWIEHSPLLEIIEFLSEKNVNVVITTDHGSVRVSKPVKIKGDKELSTNLRYKVGRLVDYNPKQVFSTRDAEKLFLPKLNLISPYIFAHENDFFAYPNNYNYYVNYYSNTFQHGGISMEEILVPFITLESK